MEAIKGYWFMDEQDNDIGFGEGSDIAEAWKNLMWPKPEDDRPIVAYKAIYRTIPWRDGKKGFSVYLPHRNLAGINFRRLFWGDCHDGKTVRTWSDGLLYSLETGECLSTPEEIARMEKGEYLDEEE